MTFIEMAIEHHRTHNGKPLDFTHAPCLIEIYTTEYDDRAIKKSSQSGISEWLIVYSVWDSNSGRTVLYVLPTYDLKGLFVRTRFDPSIGYTPLYQRLIHGDITGRYKQAESMAVKQFGAGCVIFVGTHSENAFVSHPADTLIMDELDRMNVENIKLAPSRLSASLHKKTIRVSNPTYEGIGIDDEYANSDRRQWTIRCACGKELVPNFFKHVVRQVEANTYAIRDQDYDPAGGQDIRLVCDGCERPFNRFSIGQWIPQQRHPRAGWHINKLFSSRDQVREIVERFEKGLTDDGAMQVVYNMDFGEAFTPHGARIDPTQLDACRGEYSMPETDPGPCVAGIDVGGKCNVMVARVGGDRLRVLHASAFRIESEDDLLAVMVRYGVRVFVVDAMPEMLMSRKLVEKAQRMGMIGLACEFGASATASVDPKKLKVTSNRTITLDAVKESVILKAMELPAEIRNVPDFYDQMCASTRVFEADRQRYDWKEGSRADHYFLTAGYMLLAKKIIASVKA